MKIANALRPEFSCIRDTKRGENGISHLEIFRRKANEHEMYSFARWKRFGWCPLKSVELNLKRPVIDVPTNAHEMIFFSLVFDDVDDDTRLTHRAQTHCVSVHKSPHPHLCVHKCYEYATSYLKPSYWDRQPAAMVTPPPTTTTTTMSQKKYGRFCL